MRAPLVSVIMPVYNGEKYLNDALQSIQEQTFTDFELIVADDGSTDDTARVLAGFRDAKLILVKEDHRGFRAALNSGLALAKGDYVARMDCDDIARSDRLEKQVSHLNAHPEVGIVGTACQTIDVHGNVTGLRTWPQSDVEIRWASLLTSPFAHPTVMMRRQILLEHGLRYEGTFAAAEDYDLWTRLLPYTKAANLVEPLLQYRLHNDNMTRTRRDTQLASHDAIVRRAMSRELPEFHITAYEISQLREMFAEERWPLRSDDRAHPMALAQLYFDLFEAFLRRHSEAQEVQALKDQEAVRLARFLLRHVSRPGWGALARRLVTFHPAAPWLVIGFTLRFAGCRMKRYLSGFQPT